MLSRPKKGEHCDRHPRFFAGLRLDCGNDHQLCVGCIRRWLDEGNDGKLCPMCRQQIENGGCNIGELKELIEKLQADKTMTKMDPAMPLPTELTTELFHFVDSIDMLPKLSVSRVVYSEFLATARKNGWNTDSWDFGYLWSGGRDVAVNETPEMSNVMALRPFGCNQSCDQQNIRHQHVDYFEVKMNRFVEDWYWCWVLVGLSGPDFLDEVGNSHLGHVHNSYAVGCNGFYELTGRSIENSVEFFPRDVVGCGLITKSQWKTKRQLFFTKNGQAIGKPIWISPRQTQLFPTVSFRGTGTRVTANFGGANPAKPFLYNLSQLREPEKRKGRKRKADDDQILPLQIQMPSEKREHCDRHPRFFAGLRLDCGNDHQLCVGCIRRWLDEGNDGKLCPMCRQQIGNGGCDIGELKELIEKLQADQTMTKMDPAMPLPTELITEIFRFVDSVDMPPKLSVSRVIYSEFMVTARKNGWNTDPIISGKYNHWSGDRDVAINDGNHTTHIMALRPFGCNQTCKQRQSDRHHQHVNYFEVKMGRFVGEWACWVGLGWPSFLDDIRGREILGFRDHYAIACNGFCRLAGREIEDFVEFRPGDVIGCGMITKSQWKTKRQIFFTKNGQLIEEPSWISPSHSQQFPMLKLEGRGTKVTANFDGNPAKKPFLYDWTQHKERKGRKRKFYEQ